MVIVIEDYYIIIIFIKNIPTTVSKNVKKIEKKKNSRKDLCNLIIKIKDTMLMMLLFWSERASESSEALLKRVHTHKHSLQRCDNCTYTHGHKWPTL